MKRALFLSVLLLIFISGCNELPEAGSKTLSFNSGWEFVIPADSAVAPDLFQNGKGSLAWESVNLPHTAVIEPLVMTEKQWQGTCFYRKFFMAPENYMDKHVALRFGAAMNYAEIYINGKKATTNSGGYLPFYIDLTGLLKDGENSVFVRLTNNDNPHIPPGKPIAALDFNWYSGLYRDVEMIVGNKLRITDEAEMKPDGFGGVMISVLSADSVRGALRADVEIANDELSRREVSLELILSGPDGKEIIRTKSGKILIEPGSTATLPGELSVDHPLLWSPSSPSLYLLRIDVESDGKTVDRREIRTGFRDIEFEKEGFSINGEKLWIRGTNRHQEYPYAGYAIGKNANRRDARKIKDAGFNFVRLSHYPQDPEFLNACDEFGIMVMNSIPGWQFMGDSLFREAIKSDLKRLVRRDRNHPSIILWESSLNETWMLPPFMEELHRITKEEMPFQKNFTCGWIDDVYDVFIPARQHSRPPSYWNNYNGNKPLFIAEYGDWEYYAQNAGFNQTEFSDLLEVERTSRQLRGDGQKRLAQQALNYQEAHNDNMNGAHAGDANWLMFDYNRGYAPDIESSGIMDIFRIPKFAYWFYRSQMSEGEAGAVIFISNYWSDPEFNNVRVFSNCDEVELRLNGELISRSLPDTGRISMNLKHPPFTFGNTGYKPGKLEAIGYMKGIEVTRTERVTPGKESAILLSADLSGIPLSDDETDLIFIYATVVDERGVTLPESVKEIEFTVAGSAEIIGDNPARAEAGIATIILRTKPGKEKIVVRAEATGLKGNVLSVSRDNSQ